MDALHNLAQRAEYLKRKAEHWRAVADSATEMNTLRETLIEDARKCLRLALHNDLDSPTWRRAFIRTLVSAVEGTVNGMKASVLAVSDLAEAPLTDAEKAVLKDETYDITDRGKVRTRRLHTSTLDSFKLASVILTRLHGVSYTPDYGGKGWAALRNTIQVRHRLTHPRNLADLEVSQSEIDDAVEAARWFEREHDAVYGACQAKLSQWRIGAV